MNQLIKISLPALILFIFSYISAKAQNYPDISGGQVKNTFIDKLKGRVKSITEIDYTSKEKFGEAHKDKIIHKIIYQYDDRGNKTEEDRHGSRKHTMKYDFKNNIVEEMWVNSVNAEWGNLEPGSFVGRYVSSYNERGNKLEETSYNSDGTLYEKYIYKYDKKGNKIEFNWYNSNGSLSNRKTYKHDDIGNLIEEIHYFSDGNLDEKNTYKYDNQRNRIEENWVNSGGNKSKNTYKYDANRNIIESILDDGYNYEKHTYRYDKKDYLIEDKSLYEKGSLPNKHAYKYDDKGNRIEEIFYTENGAVYSKKTWKYVYDNTGNWLKKTAFENNKPMSITEREIEYY